MGFEPYLGSQNEVGPRQMLALQQQGQEGNGLDGLAQPHLIRQNAIDPVVVQGQQELDTPQLVAAQLPSRHRRRLLHL